MTSDMAADMASNVAPDVASNVAVDVALNVAADVPSFFRTHGPLVVGSILKLGHFNGPSFSPLYFHSD